MRLLELQQAGEVCFTHVDPFEDTESFLSAQFDDHGGGFTHVDPFEDTESPNARRELAPPNISFTHVDPFEDTERISSADFPERDAKSFHPRRSVRGY